VAGRKFIVYGYTYNVACRTILRIRRDSAARRARESEIPFGNLAGFTKDLVFFKLPKIASASQIFPAVLHRPDVSSSCLVRGSVNSRASNIDNT